MIAGPSGAGKSTFYRLVRFAGQFVNADDIARELNADTPDDASIAAGRRALDILDELVGQRKDFIYETTLASHQAIKLLRQAKAAGYNIALIFVALESADLHVLRVAQRVRQGGHDIPEASIRRRYARTFDQLLAAIPLCDAVRIYNNSFEDGPVLVASILGGAVDELELTNSDFDRRVRLCLEQAGLLEP